MTPYIIGVLVAMSAGGWVGYKVAQGQSAVRVLEVEREAADRQITAEIEARRQLAGINEQLIEERHAREQLERIRARIERTAAQRAQDALRYRKERDEALRAALEPSDCIVSDDAIRLLDNAAGTN